MSLFRAKKTYIKSHSSNNFDKKITFSPAIKSSFSKPLTQVIMSDNSIKKAKENSKKEGPVGTIRFARDDEYKKSFTDTKPQYTKSVVISGPSAVRPEPIQKPDLTGVKAEGEVRPIFDDTVSVKQEPEKPELVSEIVSPLLSKPETNKQDICSKTISDEDKNKKIIKKLKSSKPKKPKKNRKNFSAVFGEIFPIAAKGLLILVIITGIGFAGYKIITMQPKTPQIVTNNTQAKPEQQVTQVTEAICEYPKTPEDIMNAISLKRQQDEAENTYQPKPYEIPDLYKYDYVKTCYLTFDDGPSETVTNNILDILKQHDIKATFFVVGENAYSYPELIKRIDAEGHSIGNHSYSHNYDYLYSSDPAFDSELSACKKAINDVLGREYENLIFRFPGGMFDKPASWYTYNINSMGYQYVNWNSLTGDSETEAPDKEYIMNALKQSTNNGKKEDIVILMHDAGAKSITSETLPDVIEYLKSKNYVFKPIYNSNYITQ